MRRRFTALWLLSGFSLLAAVAPMAAGADPLFESARLKLDSLWYATAAPGSEILFTPREIEAWTVVKAKEQVGEGLRKPTVTLETGAGSGAALVDFLKMRQARGKSTNPVMARMLEGERPLKVYLRVASSGGRCTVFLTRVEMSGTVISGAVLDYLIKTFLLPLYPDVILGEPFDLPLNIERIELAPEGVRVTMKK
jgi:hypothetical protein